MFSKVFVENATDHCAVPALGVDLPLKACLVGLTGDLPQHLQVMINLLRCEDRIKLVRAEGGLQGQLEPLSVVIPRPLTLLTSNQGADVPLSGKGITAVYDALGSIPSTPKGPGETSDLHGIYGSMLNMNVTCTVQLCPHCTRLAVPCARRTLSLVLLTSTWSSFLP